MPVSSFCSFKWENALWLNTPFIYKENFASALLNKLSRKLERWLT